MPSAKSVVITCAGIGSRLGLGTTKALINIEGRSLIAWQMELFKDVEDVRVVVGYEAKSVVEDVLKYRSDVIFVYNHNYFDTKNAASFYLGARHAGDYIIEYDGDLLVHPDDIKICLEADYEYLAYSDVMSDEAVFVKTNEQGDVTAFSTKGGDYEWTGPACLARNKVKFGSGNAYNRIEEYLPMRGLKIRACDIDTYEDYERAIELVRSWRRD